MRCARSTECEAECSGCSGLRGPKMTFYPGTFPDFSSHQSLFVNLCESCFSLCHKIFSWVFSNDPSPIAVRFAESILRPWPQKKNSVVRPASPQNEKLRLLQRKPITPRRRPTTSTTTMGRVLKPNPLFYSDAGRVSPTGKYHIA